MTTISLDGDWQLTYFPDGEYAIGHPDDLRTVDVRTIPARVPGNVELDLVRAGAIPEPFYGDSVRRLRAFEPCEWWYTREFTLPVGETAAGARWDLVFGGLDTLATVWVNGIEVGRAANMLIEHRFDVTAALNVEPDAPSGKGAANHVAVRLGSALNHARRFQYDVPV